MKTVSNNHNKTNNLSYQFTNRNPIIIRVSIHHIPYRLLVKCSMGYTDLIYAHFKPVNLNIINNHFNE